MNKKEYVAIEIKDDKWRRYHNITKEHFYNN